MDSVDLALPDSVLNEVAYFAQGGDGSCSLTPPGKPEMDQPPKQAELYESLILSACGWNPGDLVTVTVTDPAGKITQEQQDANQGMGLSAWAAARLFPTLPGEYKFNFNGPDGDVTFVLPVFAPANPRLFSLFSEGVLIVYGLQPGEHITILAYQPKQEGTQALVEFVGSQDYQADENGFLSVNIPREFFLYFAIGEVSGNMEDGNGFFILKSSIFKE